MLNILLVRHCSAIGQEPYAPLSEEGEQQAEHLASSILQLYKPIALYSSPYTRALQSVTPLAKSGCLQITEDPLLREREFCRSKLWCNEQGSKVLKQSFEDLSLCYGDGESNEEATERARNFISKLVAEYAASGNQDATYNGAVVVASHGNMIALLLAILRGSEPSFQEMISLTNPDVYLVRLDLSQSFLPANLVKRLWAGPSVGIEVQVRRAARALLYDSTGTRVGLLKYDLSAMKSGTGCIWLTPGGGIEPDETPELALARELFEEQCLQLGQDCHLLGLIWQNTSPKLIWNGAPVIRHDFFYAVQLSAHKSIEEINIYSVADAWERQYIVEHRWWSIEELSSEVAEKFVPDFFADENLLRQ